MRLVPRLPRPQAVLPAIRRRASSPHQQPCSRRWQCLRLPVEQSRVEQPRSLGRGRASGAGWTIGGGMSSRPALARKSARFDWFDSIGTNQHWPRHRAPRRGRPGHSNLRRVRFAMALAGEWCSSSMVCGLGSIRTSYTTMKYTPLCRYSRLSTSAWRGSAAWAPKRVVANAAAALAKRVAWANVSPRARHTASAATNASPAPVASTVRTGK